MKTSSIIFNLFFAGVLLVTIGSHHSYAASPTALPPCTTATPTPVNGSRCGTGQVTLSVTGTPPSGYILRWYDAAGNFITQGDGGYIPDYLTPSISTTTTYQAAYYLVSNGCTGPKVSVIATVNSATSVSAGPDKGGVSMCGLTSTTLAASPAGGTWSIISGSGGTVVSPTSNTSTFTGTAGTSYTLRWTGSASCTTGPDDVVITFTQNPSPAPNAGSDLTACNGTTYVLSGNTPTVGTARWSVNGDSTPPGTGSISPLTSAGATLTGVVGGIYAVDWTFTNGVCTLSDEAIIVLSNPPGNAVAGADQVICGAATTTLSANNPSVGTKTWSVVSGSGGSFGNTSSPTSSFSGTLGTSYTLRWTVSVGSCSNTDDVNITFGVSPTTSNAGPDQNVCVTTNSVALAANTPSVGTGSWSIISGFGGSLGTPSSPTSTLTGSYSNLYVARWTITNGSCTSSDDVTIFMRQAPNVSAAPSTQSSCAGQTATINISNPNGVSGTTFTWTTSAVNVDLPSVTQPASTISGTYTNSDGVSDGTVTYTITPGDGVCTGTPTTATINVLNTPSGPTPSAPLFYGTSPAVFQAYAPSGTTTQWYTAASGGTAFATGDVYTNPSTGSPLTYYVSFKNTANSCESFRTTLTAITMSGFSPAAIIGETIRIAGKTTDPSINALTSPAQKVITVTYADGLARAIQTIAVKGSPGGKDIVAPAEYDAAGRASTQYLSYTKTLSTTIEKFTGDALPGYQTGFKADQLTFYSTSNDQVADDSYPFAKSVYEASPIGRPLEQGKAGSDWQPTGSHHTQRVAYSFNNSTEGDDVRIFVNPFVVSSAVTTQSYSNSTLNRTTITDENNHTEIVFTDFGGNVVMRKKQLDGGTDYLRTAYVYDEKGQLKYIIPPAGYAALQTANWVLSQSILDAHIYQFVYDSRGRLTQKKVPGQDWIYYGYDKLNRVVLIQDGNIRAANKWIFMKYDRQGRVVMTGLYTNATQTSLSSIQGLLDALYPLTTSVHFETRGATLLGYTNLTFPTTAVEADLLTVNYFDNYDFDNNGTADYTYDNTHLSGLPATARTYTYGLPTGLKRKVLGTTNTWLVSGSFLDNYARPMQAFGNNYLNLSATDKSSTVYDFEGKATSSKSIQNGASGNIVVAQTPVYNNVNALTGMQHSINGASNQLVAQYVYNELGQVVRKQLHDTGGSVFLQNVDFRYNINGWLSSINNATLTNDGDKNLDANDLFGLELLYNVADAGLGNTSNYNGNISAVKWKNAIADPGTKGQSNYNFTYDKTDKLLSASFKKMGASTWNAEVGTLDETMTYDYNGNILSLQRKRQDPTNPSTVQNMDVLSYTYASGNLLSKVEDTGLTAGFNNGANITTEYTYDTNGNLTADANKGITSITYNELGKPKQVTFTGKTVVYTYDGIGTKLRMVTTISGVTTTTDYVGGSVYTNSAIDFFPSPEGRVKKNTSGFEYQYFIGDHQGNTRLVFTSAPTYQTVTATFETAAQTTEATQFNNYPSSSGINPVSTNNHTAGGSKSQYLSAGLNGQVGVSKSYRVLPGDKLKIEAYARYTAASGSSNLANFAVALLAAFSLPAPAIGETGTPSAAMNSWGTLAAGGFGDGSTDSGHPKAFVNILLFDNDFNFLDVAYSQVTSSGTPGYLTASYTATKAGYAFIYISNESATLTDVYFDDVAISFAPMVIQSTDYYPFGQQMESSLTRAGNSNNFLYDNASELNTTTGLYDLPYRNYDASLGRFFQVDAMAVKFHTMSPFVYAGNNPINANDPTGLMVDYSHSSANPDYVWQMQEAAMNAQNNALNQAMLDRTFAAGPVGGGNYEGGMGGGIGGGGAYMSAGEFITWGLRNIMNGGYGGNWSNGVARGFTSNEQGLVVAAAQITASDGWGSTTAGSYANAVAAYVKGQSPGSDKNQQNQFEFVNEHYSDDFDRKFGQPLKTVKDPANRSNADITMEQMSQIFARSRGRYSILNDKDGLAPDLELIGYSIFDYNSRTREMTTSPRIALQPEPWGDPIFQNPGLMDNAGQAPPIMVTTSQGAVGITLFFRYVPSPTL